MGCTESSTQEHSQSYTLHQLEKVNKAKDTRWQVSLIDFLKFAE